MANTWIIVDGNNVCHRAHHSTGGLSHGDEPTGVTFGVLRDLIRWGELFNTHQFVFCFDHGKQLRVQKYPHYKETRRKKRLDEDKAAEYAEITYQIDKLRQDHLPALGFTNVFWQKGYEADDLMAAAVNALPEGDQAVLIGSDKDIYQLLRRDVSIYAPQQKTTTSKKSFRSKWYGLDPSFWTCVKAIAGCGTDDVHGLDGVGEITAAKYVANHLGTKLDTYKRISKFVRTQQYRDNLELVTLPYPGTKSVDLMGQSEIDPDKWAELTERLGIGSLTLGEQPDDRWRSGTKLGAPRG